MSNRDEVSADKSQELELARRISSEAHHGQTDKTGEPYVNHCERVADRVDGAEEKTVAFLHDIVEKCDGWDFERLRQLGFGDDIVEAVDALTHRQDETDDQFVVRAVENKIACPVKIADLQDNLHQANAMGLDPVKYKRGLELVTMVRTDPNLTGLT
ncbi:HD domain-containing protein [Rhizobium sp. S152]|uniref:HD domain-containing protein n=1 Tax=Rhizobium sp. S152 TaxID=3055038 RepID=UPI0025A99399|nr:HD domain-containing protein [Rhizobium sp. S152]MDM9625196.1 HD domain-containing protein [Rhizobium sp. S152]